MSNQKANPKKVKKNLDLPTFLNNFRVGKGEEHSHTCMGKPFMGSFNIPDEQMNLFFNLYEKEYLSGKKLCLIEKHKPVGPIIIDVDLKFEPEFHQDENGEDILNENNEKVPKLERKYQQDLIKKIVKLYMDAIEESFDLSDSDKSVALIFERKTPYFYKGEVKDGIHIMFPYIVSEPSIQYLIREKVIKLASDEDILSVLPLKKKVYSEIFDRKVIHENGWFMYGSSKPYCSSYELTHIYNTELESVPKDELDYQGHVNLAKFLSIRRFYQTECTPLKNQVQEGLDKMIKKQKVYTQNSIKKKGPSNTNYDIKVVAALVKCLSMERAENYSTWIEVGWCLHNIDPTNVDLLNLWIEFSASCPQKFKEGECENKWKGFRNDGLTMGSLAHWAREDNYEAYMDIKREDVQHWIEKSVNATHYDIGKVLESMYKGQFICTSFTQNIWYEFKDHRWRQIDGGIELRKKISNDLVEEYVRLISKYNILASLKPEEMDADNTYTEDQQDEFYEHSKQLHRITNDIKTSGFKDNVLKECREIFYQEKFVEKMDENPWLIGFENGVYDLQNHEFREGRPEDCISFSTKNEYKVFSDDDPNVIKVMEFMDQLFTKPEMRDYMLTVLASHLQGINQEEKFRIWIGEGANGKSKLNELMQLAFGEYCYKFPITLLTQKRAKSNQAQPEVVAAKGKRYCYFEEPDEDERINTGLLKEYSGNDIVKGRGLYEKNLIEFKPQWKMNLLSNHMLDLPAHERSVWRRIEAIEYESHFTYDPKGPNEFPRDDKLSSKMVEWKEAFMYVLIQYHKKYAKFGIKVPAQVTEFTKRYEQENDKYSDFTLRYLERTGNYEDKLDLEKVYEEFKFWHGDANSGAKMPSKRDIKKYFDKALGRNFVNLGEIRGYRLNMVDKPIKDKGDDPYDVENMFSMSSSTSSLETLEEDAIKSNIKKIKIVKKKEMVTV
jgi:P4 family phage/plasmid primase-like protien